MRVDNSCALNADGNRLILNWNRSALNCNDWNGNPNDNVGGVLLMV